MGREKGAIMKKSILGIGTTILMVLAANNILGESLCADDHLITETVSSSAIQMGEKMTTSALDNLSDNSDIYTIIDDSTDHSPIVSTETSAKTDTSSEATISSSTISESAGTSILLVHPQKRRQHGLRLAIPQKLVASTIHQLQNQLFQK